MRKRLEAGEDIVGEARRFAGRDGSGVAAHIDSADRGEGLQRLAGEIAGKIDEAVGGFGRRPQIGRDNGR